MIRTTTDQPPAPEPRHTTATTGQLVGVRSILTLVTVVALAFLISVQPVAAHTDLVGSDPTEGAVLDAVPDAVRLTFNEEVEPQFADVAVTVGDGEASEVAVQVEGAEVIADVASAITGGAEPDQPTPWLVAYRVVSGDGHPITGTITFTVTTPATPPSTQPTSTPGTPSAEPSPSQPPAATSDSSPPGPSRSPSAPADEAASQEAGGSGAGATPWLLAAAGAVLAMAIVAWLVRRRGSSEP